MAGMCGGMAAPEPASKECQTYLDQFADWAGPDMLMKIFKYLIGFNVRAPAEEKAGRTFSKFEAKLCANQLVNGINYFVKVDVGDGKFVHIRFHKTFQDEVTFHSLQDDKAEEELLAYF